MAALAVALIAAAVLLRGQTGNAVQWLRHLLQLTQDWLATANPLLLFLAMVALPLAGFPVSPLWVLAGAAFGVFWGFLFSLAALAANLAVAYLLATRVLRSFLQQLLARRGITVPRALPSEYVKLTVVLRITPGVPLFVQNYALGLSDIPFRIFFLVSLPFQAAYAFAFIKFGESIFAMKGGGVLLAVCLLVALTLVVGIIRKRLGGLAVAPELNK